LTDLDPIDLQVISGALRAACEEMGAVLVRAAHSPNIKERRDASSALFDAGGEMVMQDMRSSSSSTRSRADFIGTARLRDRMMSQTIRPAIVSAANAPIKIIHGEMSE
jgi:N-methylhydantoinase B/oxoprolinase/acetone carboxylase alpha subunit